jgi:flavin reductase (DIM6/NTAB) family NADH-FMN oxidoreductase RutF
MHDKNLATAMRAGMRRLASGVCVLSARLDDNEDFAMTVSSVTSVSDSPASLLVCINQLVSKQAHLSTPGCRFAINVLGAQHQDVSNVCAGRMPDQDRFSVGHWEVREGIPILADAQAVFLCEADKISTYGTHHIVVAKISQVIVSTDPVNLLLYADASYGSFLRDQNKSV